MGLSRFIWYFNLKPDLSTTVRMPSGARITECEHGILITYPDGVKRWMAKDWFDEIDTDKL